MNRASTAVIGLALTLALSACGGNGGAAASSSAASGGSTPADTTATQSEPPADGTAEPSTVSTTAELPTGSGTDVPPATEPAPPAGTQLFRGASGTFTVVLPSGGTTTTPMKTAPGMSSELALENSTHGWRVQVISVGKNVPENTLVDSTCIATQADAEKAGAKVTRTNDEKITLDGQAAVGCRLDDSQAAHPSTAWVYGMTRGDKVYSLLVVAPGVKADAVVLRDTLLGTWHWER